MLCFESYLLQTILLLLLVSAVSVQNTSNPQISKHITRKETGNFHLDITKDRAPRYIVFPKKSNIVLSLVLLKATNVGRGLNTLHEIDFFFPLPTRPVFLQRQQRSMRVKVMNAFEMFGLNGASCLKRTFCEMKMIDERLKQSQGAEDLAQELLTIVLGKMENFIESQNTNQCKSVDKLCSVSFFNLWHHFFDSVINYLESNRS